MKFKSYTISSALDKLKSIFPSIIDLKTILTMKSNMDFTLDYYLQLVFD